jgi:hypothetical protein
MRNLNDPYVKPESGNLNETSPYGLNTDIPASAGSLKFVPKNMCDESPFYKEITDRKNNMSDEDIEKQRRFNAQAEEAIRQRRIENNLEKKDLQENN